MDKENTILGEDGQFDPAYWRAERVKRARELLTRMDRLRGEIAEAHRELEDLLERMEEE